MFSILLMSSKMCDIAYDKDLSQYFQKKSLTLGKEEV